MQATIINAAPMVISRGTQDLSTRQLPRTPEAIPQHCAKTYLYTKKGPLTPQLVVGDSRVSIFGEDSFDLRKKWANHATVLSNLINAEGNAQMIQRLIPADAGPEANFLLSLDVLATTVTQYQRNADGSFVLNAGAKVPLSGPITYAGYKVKWVVSTIADKEDLAEDFGALTTGVGGQTDSGTSTQSVLYPILQFKASSIGAIGNDAGIRLWAPVNDAQNTVNSRILQDQKAYPFRLSVVRRPDSITTPGIVETQFAEQYMDFTFKQNVIDPSTDKQFYIGDVYADTYSNTKDARYPSVFGDFGEVAVYDANIKTVVELFYAAEKAHPYTENDFTSAGTPTTEGHLFNFVSGQSSNAAPYNTFELLSTGNSVIRPSEFTNIFAKSGSDGTMTDALFAGLVTTEVTKYGDAANELQDIAYNVESIIYDSGFPLATKKALCNFIAVRKDTFVVLSTHDTAGAPLTASEEHSLAIALRTHAQLYPESDYFGTPVMRAMIVGRSGKLRNSQWAKEVPCTMEVAIKAARYMGAGDGKWKSGFNFDGDPGSILDYIYDVNVTFTPATVRNKDWDAGLNWVQRFDRSSFFFPALKTVCSDDTSVLNSFSTAMAICQINKVAHSVWRSLSGTDHLTNAQLCERANEKFNERINNRFDGRFVIEPNAFISDADRARGYSWTLPVKIYAPNMKTVMTTNVQAFRLDDLASA